MTDAPTRFDPAAIFDALARHNVEYVTVGGIAIQAHGGQRLTQDLDVVIAASSDNAGRLAHALVELDARILGPDGRRSRTVPTAALLGSSDHWRLITASGALDVFTLPATLGRLVTCASVPMTCRWAMSRSPSHIATISCG